MKLNPNFDKTYEPTSLNDIVFTYKQQSAELSDHINGSSGFPSNGINGILLVGGTGSGKSTLARLLPNWIEIERGGEEAVPKFCNITTASNSGVDLLDQIERQVQLIPFSQMFHYIVLDEVDLMSSLAMGKLKSVMNIAFGNSIFIMTTNNVGKIAPPVVDRCHVFYLDHAPSAGWLPLFNRILNDHGITHVTREEMLEKIDMCNGSGRKVIESAKKIIRNYGEEASLPQFYMTANVV
jgi:DNA polymerase III gamma/tau subunit